MCGTKHFTGVARMTSNVRTDAQFQLWEKLKYEGFFHVEWLLVKDVPNYVLTGVKMSNTPTKKSITSCRDCEEVLLKEVRCCFRGMIWGVIVYFTIMLHVVVQANEFLTIFTEFKSRSSALDDFAHYDQLQVEIEQKRRLVFADGVDKTDMNSYLVPVQQESPAST